MPFRNRMYLSYSSWLSFEERRNGTDRAISILSHFLNMVDEIQSYNTNEL